MPYLGKQSEQVGVSIQKYEFLQATDTSSGTTSFSVPSDAGDHVNVWLNGVLLVEGASNDYTTTSTTVVFGSAPADGDIIRIDVVESFSLPDALKSSGDTMTGPLKLDGGLKQQTSQDLSGTYAYHQMMISDAFTVAGDVTISDNLVLTKISDDSNAITLTDDGSTRTITGTGSLETSTIAQTPNSSLTGMTGTIGSAVTFPAGMPIEQIMSPCDGSSITVQSGTYTVQNVTGRQALTTTYTDVTGSVIDYVPPSGTQTVVYTFNFLFSAVDAHPIAHLKLFLDNDSGTPTEVTNASSSFGAENWHEGKYTVIWAFHIGGSDNDATGRRDTWTSPRTIKLQGKSQNTNLEAELHYGEYNAVLMQPVIGITAIAG